MISWLKRFNWGLNSDSGKRGKNKRRHVVARNRRRTILEQLEGRQLLAVVTVFSDNFETSTGATYDTSGAIGSSDVWNVSPTADFGARIHDGILDLTNTATAAANANGSVFGYFDNSTATAPWTSTLSSNPGTVSWEFNMRQIRPNPAGFGVGNYGAAFVLAGTSSEAATKGNGYAVVLGNSQTPDPLRLVSYTGGLQGTLADIITSNTEGLASFGAQYLSVRIEYTPSSNQWQMFLRNDGTSAFTDPTTGSALVSQGTAVDSTFTSTADKNFTGGYWNGSTAGNQTAFFDNFYLKVGDPGPSTTPAVVLSPNVSTVSVVEGGATASLNLSFTQLPTSNVTVTITPSNNEVDLGNGAGVARILTFTPTDATTAQSFLITAIDDTIVEGPHDSVLTFAIASAARTN